MTAKSDLEFQDAAAPPALARAAHGDLLHLTEQLIRQFSAQDETHTVSMWIKEIEEHGDVFQWSPTQVLLVARRSLTGTAALWLRSEKVFKSWEDLKVAIGKEFPDTLDVKKIHELMSARRKKKDESCIDYMLIMKELGKRGKMPDYVAIKYIVDGIIDDEINKIMLYGITTYADLKEKLKLYATFKKNSVKDIRRSKPPSGTQSANNNRRNAAEMMRCFNCGEKNHSSENCPHRSQGKKCFHCNEFGHISPNCPKKKMASSASGAFGFGDQEHEQFPKVGTDQRESTNQMSKKTFFNMMQEGATSCASDEVQDDVQGEVYTVTRTNDSCYDVGNTIPRWTAIGYRDDGHVVGFDTSNVNKQNKKSVENVPVVNIVRRIKPLKPVFVRGKRASALIDSGCDVNLMSKDFYNELSKIDFVQCNENNITLTGLGYSQVKSCGVVMLDITIDNCLYRNTTFYVMPNDSVPFQMIIGNAFLRNVMMFMKDCMVWLLPKDDWMNPNYEWLKDVAYFSSSVDCLAHVSNPAVKEEVTRLVTSYVPQQSKEAPIELKIVLKDDLPVSQRPRRISFKEQEDVNRQIQEWLEDGIIRVSYSEYSSPLVLVRKKDGGLRICIDYRKINSKMVKDEYPLPIIDEHIDKLSSARVFSALDLKNGYFHLRVHEDSIKYTSFVTTTGQYEFLRAPFGLATCPKVFTRFITIIFRELIARGIVIVFIDDILIPAEDEYQALERLKEVLNTASEYGLQINWKKSQLLSKKVEYLGHVIEGGAVMPSPGKTDAVTKFPEPQNLKQLHSFLGLCSYFRKFIPRYAQIAQPLTDMLKKGCTFEFSDAHRAIFKELKTRLASKPVLKIYDQRAETELHTDASGIAYSAILMQRGDDGNLHPVHYMSRKTTDAQAKYTSYELEALAIIEGVKKYRHYLYGKFFKIVTDCKAFQMTLNKKDLASSTRVARWILFLQDYDFTVEHRDGTGMRHVDALSRNPYVAAITSSLHQDIRRAQECDEGLSAIIKILKEGNAFKDYSLSQELLYKGLEQQLVIPSTMENEIIKRAHSNGHFAKKKTLELISKDYYIEKIGKKVEDYIASCIPCLLTNRKEGKQEGYLNPIEKGDTPLQTLHLDHVGPLTETHKQYNHILTVIDAFTKFVWLFPCKSTTTREVLNKLEILQHTFGSPERFITDRGTAFTSNEFQQYCMKERIELCHITTGVPRGNGQVERVHRTIIPVLTKLCIEKPGLWYRHVGRVQMALNSTYQRSVNTTPFEMLIGKKMKRQDDIEIYELLQQEGRDNYMENREDLRKRAKQQILEVQQENRRNYDKHRKDSSKYQEGELVAIKRTQFGPGLKLKPKYLGPYQVTKTKRHDRYDVEKVDMMAEGPVKTTTSADHMKKWPDDKE